VDAKLIELSDKVKTQATKIKALKKEKKEIQRQHEKEEAERKEREHQRVFDQQRQQIEQLNEQLQIGTHTHSHTQGQSQSQHASPGPSETKGGMMRTKSMISPHYFREDEEEEETDSTHYEDDEHYHMSDLTHPNPNMQPYRQISAPGMLTMPESTQSYAPGTEGQYQMAYGSQTTQKPLLSDGAIRVVGGVIVVVVGIWALSRYFNSNSKQGMSTILRRAPRVHY